MANHGHGWLYRDEHVSRDAEIRELFGDFTQTELAAMFGLCRATIRQILGRRNKARAAAVKPEQAAGPPLTSMPPPALPAGDWGPLRGHVPGIRSPNAKLSDADAETVRRLRADGVSRAELAAQFRVSPATITRITRGETYRTALASAVVPERPRAATVAPSPATVETQRWETPEQPGPEWRDD
jgi:Helix-turn-helix domain of resolvase